MSEDESVVEISEAPPEAELPAESVQAVPSPPPRRKRGWLLNLLLGLLIFSCGAVTGGGVALHIAWNRVTATLQHPEQAPEGAAKRLTRILRLDDKQAAEVKAILEHRFQDIAALRREMGPRVDEEVQAIRDEISAVLRPDQVQRWEKLFDTLRPRLFSPGGKEKPPRRLAN